jgi:hypothetical protein
MRRSGAILALAAWLLGTLAAAAGAHPAISAAAVVKVGRGGSVSVDVRLDILAFALNDSPSNVADAPMYELLNGPDAGVDQALTDARARFLKLCVLTADDRPVALQIDDFPTTAAIRQWERQNPERRLPIKMSFAARGVLPDDARFIAFRFPDVLGDVVTTVDRPGQEPEALPLRPGEPSPRFDLRPTETQRLGALGVFWRYVVLGFTHIIPQGADHALFVLGLFLLSPRLKAVVWQITAFTVAHTTTLTLATLHLVHIDSRVIEPTIAATIAFVGIENLFTDKVHPWRPVVAFIFGLVHGLGFASALSEVGLPTTQLVSGLAGFTVGVEGGHLAVLAIAALTLGWWRTKPWYRHRISIPLSSIIAAIAIFWMVQRLAQKPEPAIPPPSATAGQAPSPANRRKRSRDKDAPARPTAARPWSDAAHAPVLISTATQAKPRHLPFRRCRRRPWGKVRHDQCAGPTSARRRGRAPGRLQLRVGSAPHDRPHRQRPVAPGLRRQPAG